MTISFVQGSEAPTVTAVAVSGRHMILVICGGRELVDLEEVEAERLDQGRDALQRRPVQTRHHRRASVPHHPDHGQGYWAGESDNEQDCDSGP
jgi:hypothetical protein